MSLIQKVKYHDHCRSNNLAGRHYLNCYDIEFGGYYMDNFQVRKQIATELVKEHLGWQPADNDTELMRRHFNSLVELVEKGMKAEREIIEREEDDN